MFEFAIEARAGAARAGTLRLPHGVVRTPAFMPVGTQATVKTISRDELVALGAEIILSNTYHLYLRPGHGLIYELGGLHGFMSWPRPVLTDSGGFQVFSLAATREISDHGVRFQSHIDGSYHLFTPESVIEVQRALGADVIMAFDECPPGRAARELAVEAHERTLPQITATELKARLDRGEAPAIIDVREPHEWEIVNLGEHGARLIPLGQLTDRMSELDSAADIVLHCRSGARSAKALEQLREAGFRKLHNLDGGILAWAETVDPSLPRY